MAPQLFAWQAWHFWHWTGFGGALGYFGRLDCLQARRSTWRHRLHSAWRGTYGTGLALAAPLGTLVAAAVCVAGVALGDIDRHFAWQAWHLATSTCILRGRRGTSVTGLGVVARLVLWSPRLFACQVWHLVTSTVAGLALGHIDVHSGGRRGTW